MISHSFYQLYTPSSMPISNRLSRDERLQIPELYQAGLDTVDIGKKFDVHKSTISYHLRQLGIATRPQSDPVRRQCSVNDYAFDILTPEACYWAGMIFTDGTFQATPGHTPI